MWFSLFATVLILAAAFYQGLQGLFSSLITCILTILSAALAFGLYEDLYFALLISYQPDHGRAIALLAIFVITLLVLRMVSDQLIQGNMQFSLYVDRAGGGVFGFVTAMIIIGMLAIGFQMLPFGPAILGFNRHGDVLDAESGRPMVVSKGSIDEIIKKLGEADDARGLIKFKSDFIRFKGTSAEIGTFDPSSSRNDIDRSEGTRSVPLALMADELEEFARKKRGELSSYYVRIEGARAGSPIEILENPDGNSRTNTDWWKSAKVARNNLWLHPDGFTVTLISHLSDNSLSGRHRFKEFNPDFLDHLQDMRNGGFRESLATVGKDSLHVEGYWYLTKDEHLYARERVRKDGKEMVRLVSSERELASGWRRIVVRVTVNEDKSRAEDSQNLHFTTEQVRLFGRAGEGGPVETYSLAGINDQHFHHLLVDLGVAEDVQYKREGTGMKLDLLFEVPDEPKFQPLRIEYKQNARDEVRESRDLTQAPPPPLTGGAEPEDRTTPHPGGEGRPDRDDQPGGHVHVYAIGNRDPVFSDKLPFKLTRYSPGTNFQLSGGKLRGGRNIVATLDEDWQPIPGTDRPIESFDVPDNMRLLQLSVDKLDPQSWLGTIFGRMKEKIKNIFLIDDRGHKYMPVGTYAMAKVNGRPTFELIYLDDIERDMARIPDFSRIKNRDLRGEYSCAFLFHVPPGTRVKAFNTANRQLPLGRFDLVARE